jgi:hypothetical protein
MAGLELTPFSFSSQNVLETLLKVKKQKGDSGLTIPRLLFAPEKQKLLAELLIMKSFCCAALVRVCKNLQIDNK